MITSRKYSLTFILKLGTERSSDLIEVTQVLKHLNSGFLQRDLQVIFNIKRHVSTTCWVGVGRGVQSLQTSGSSSVRQELPTPRIHMPF